jgi:hypothetical protein
MSPGLKLHFGLLIGQLLSQTNAAPLIDTVQHIEQRSLL